MVDNNRTFSFGSTFDSAFMAPPAKRKRFAIGSSSVVEEPPASIIQDPRIPHSEALRLNCPFITILVGPPEVQEPFYVHEHVICDRSSFFKSAMRPEWAAQRTDPRTIELPDDDPTAFSRGINLPRFYLVYQSYLYTGHLPILPDISTMPPSTNLTPGHPLASSQSSQSTVSASQPINGTAPIPSISQTLPLAHAYILGDRLLDTPFKNLIASTYVLFARGTPPGKRSYPSNEEIRILFDGTREGAPIRQLLVDIWCTRGKADWMKESDDEGEGCLPREFLWEVTKGLLSVRGNLEDRRAVGERGECLASRPWKDRHVQYHEKEQ